MIGKFFARFKENNYSTDILFIKRENKIVILFVFGYTYSEMGENKKEG